MLTEPRIPLPCSDQRVANVEDLPLVVDLDFTLVNSDTLHETLLLVAARQPLRLMGLPALLARGKAAVKAHLAQLAIPDPVLLPYNPSVLDYVRTEVGRGRKVCLATAADRQVAEAVAGHLELFSRVFASDGVNNLAAQAKAEALVGVFGERGFDYIGNSVDDLAVWARARHSLVVREMPALADRARAAGFELHPLSPASPVPVRAMLRALRPHQWLKNLLVLVAPLAAHALDVGTLAAALLAMIAFSLAASAGYLVNDLLDLPSDRAHPNKRRRPFANGDLPVKLGVMLAPVLLLAGLSIALWVTPGLMLLLAGYWVLSLAYSLVLKRAAPLDVMILSGLYVLRIFGGSIATGIDVSHWLLVFSMFLFLSLAMVKRVIEIVGRREAEGARIPGRGYQSDDLPVLQQLATSAGIGAVLLLGLYVSSEAAGILYRRADLLWLLCPLLIFWLSRIFLLANRGVLHDDPLVFAATDQGSLTLIAVCVALLLVAI